MKIDDVNKKWMQSRGACGLGRLVYNVLRRLNGVCEVRLNEGEPGCQQSVMIALEDAVVSIIVDFNHYRVWGKVNNQIYVSIFSERGDVWHIDAVERDVKRLITGQSQAVVDYVLRVLAVAKLVRSCDDAYYDNLEANEVIANLGIRRLAAADGVTVYSGFNVRYSEDDPQVVVNVKADASVDINTVDPLDVLRLAQAGRVAADPSVDFETFDAIIKRFSELEVVYVDADILKNSRFTYILDGDKPLLVRADGFDTPIQMKVLKFCMAVEDTINARCSVMRALSAT